MSVAGEQVGCRFFDAVWTGLIRVSLAGGVVGGDLQVGAAARALVYSRFFIGVVYLVGVQQLVMLFLGVLVVCCHALRQRLVEELFSFEQRLQCRRDELIVIVVVSRVAASNSIFAVFKILADRRRVKQSATANRQAPDAAGRLSLIHI